jgi:hypothetical protein
LACAADDREVLQTVWAGVGVTSVISSGAVLDLASWHQVDAQLTAAQDYIAAQTVAMCSRTSNQYTMTAIEADSVASGCADGAGGIS